MNKRPNTRSERTPVEQSNGHHPVRSPEQVSSPEQDSSRDFRLAAVPGVLSDSEAELLARPQITLFANGDDESQRAFSAIAEAHIGFRVVATPDASYPSAQWGDHSFEGLEEIQMLATTLQDVAARLNRDIALGASPLYERRDPQLVAWMERLYQGQLATAHASMEELRRTVRSRTAP